MKSVVQFARNGEFIARYNSMTNAAKAVGCTKQAIYNTLKFPEKYKTVKGYVFKKGKDLTDER